ncbi:putative metal-binding motif-containing protein [Nanoarchaeota archaeon]
MESGFLIKKGLVILLIFIFAITLVQAQDSDADGVEDSIDLCGNTDLSESVPTKRILFNRFALIDGDSEFDTKEIKNKRLKKFVKLFSSKKEYTTADTCGCSCEQILLSYDDRKRGHWKFGCSSGLIDDFAETCSVKIDNDQDGYYIDSDCNDEDATINPGATEVCDDGVDNNCDGETDEGCVISCEGVLATDPNVCLERGVCTNVDVCDCIDGYFGSNCELEKECNGVSMFSTDVCSAKGTCELDGTCTCNADYDDVNCETYTGLSCYGKLPAEACNIGVCTDQDNCLCPEGYIGNECEDQIYCAGVWQLDENVCSGQGTCNNNGLCECWGQFEGLDCSELPQEPIICDGIYSTNIPEVCNGRGDCIETEVCVCNEGWEGDFCADQLSLMCFNLPEYDDAVCSGNGLCIGDNQCLCDAQWSGDECQDYSWTCFNEMIDSPYVCNNGHGECVAQDTCVCGADYKGIYCQLPILAGFQCGNYLSEEPEVCSGRGACIADGQCSCDIGYSGLECEHLITCNFVSALDPGVCSGVGTCFGVDNCQCPIGYFGDNCELTSA